MAPVALEAFLKQSFARPDSKAPEKDQTDLKTWAAKFATTGKYPLEHRSDVLDDEEFLGPLLERDKERLKGKMIDLGTHDSFCMTENEVEVHFTENVLLPLKIAFNGDPKLWFQCQRSIRNPDLQTIKDPAKDSLIIVDWAIRYPNHEKNNICVGEIKKPGVIHPREWLEEDTNDAPTINLWKELTGYAHYYKVKSAFCYDSRHLLILHWKKQVRGGKPEVLVIPVEKEDPSVREAMYHLLCKCLPENFDEPGSGD